MATLTNTSGCDSVVTLNLTINSSNTGSQTTTACNSYIWTANGMTYMSSGTYMATLTNASGCDSVVTLNLTINNSNNTTTFITACNPYTWPVNGMTYATSGTYYDITTNMTTGCQDTATLNLTVGSSAIDNINPMNSNCYTSIETAINDAMPGDTIHVNSGSYSESFEVPEGVTLIINAPATVNNSGLICNNGVIIYNNGSFINTAVYRGRGNFIGTIVNSNNGKIKPGSCN
jgi:hypothetical protein